MGPYREQEIVEILNSNEPESLASLLQAAHNTRIRHLGNEVYLRGLIEFSNYCPRNCLYCGLRKSNENIHRYRLDEDKIIELAMMAYDMGFQSIALQSGEIDSQEQVDFLAAIVEKIILSSRQRGQQGLGVTLSMGELSYQQYLQLWQAGAHRYLLRIETSNPQLFKNIHPPSQLYHRRLECLDALKDIGYQVGTGIMVGLPGQSNEQDLSAHVKWSGTGEFDPPVGALSCPSFSTPGTHTITIAAEVDGKIHQQSITVSVVSFFATNGSFKYAAIGDKVTGQPHGHGCPACPHADINGVIVSGSPNVLLGGLPAARKGDTGVHCCCCGPNTFTIEEGDPNVLIDGRPAARLGDKTMHCATAPGKIVAIRDHYNRSEAP